LNSVLPPIPSALPIPLKAIRRASGGFFLFSYNHRVYEYCCLSYNCLNNNLDEEGKERIMADNPYDLNRSVGFMMGTAYRKMTALFHNRLKEFEITPEQWSVLYCVDREDGLIQKEIAERSGKDRPTTTRLLDHLEKKELVYRRTGEQDRRSFRVYATDKGRELIRVTIPIEKRMIEEVRACVADEEYDALLALLYRINEHMKVILDQTTSE